MKKDEMAQATVAVAIWLAGVSLLVWAVWGAVSDSGDKDVNCYSVTDAAGNVYESFTPTDGILTEGGPVVVYKTEDDWGFVYGPITSSVDKDCLRERGVEVPELEPEDAE